MVESFKTISQDPMSQSGHWPRRSQWRVPVEVSQRSCSKHLDLCKLSSSFLWDWRTEYNDGPGGIWKFIFLKKLPRCSPEWPYHFALLLTTNARSKLSLSSAPGLGCPQAQTKGNFHSVLLCSQGPWLVCSLCPVFSFSTRCPGKDLHLVGGIGKARLPHLSRSRGPPSILA